MANWLFWASAAAQTDSLRLLPTVEVQAAPLQSMQPGMVTERWVTSAQHPTINQSVADFLRNNTNIYLKSYGLGSLTTTSIRGASAGQTAVIWNGFQIQSPMLGLLDWSLLPAFFSDEVNLQHGGNGAVWGSGAMGGALLMNNRPDFSSKKSIQLSAGTGSFGLWNGQLALKLAGKKWASSTRVFHQKAENDFTYSLDGQAQKRQTNASFKQQGLLQEFYWRPNTKHQISFHAWLQSSFREIPPTSVQTKSVAQQKDKALRTALHWHYAKGKSQYQLRTSLFFEEINYQDKLASVNSLSHFWTNITEGELQHFLTSKIKLQIIGNQTFTKAFTKYYADASRRRQAALASSFRYEDGPWSAQIDLRQEMLNNQFLPITTSMGFSKSLGKYLKIGGKIGRTYRVPTLNDLYWVPGGNQDLWPESGWGEELNAQFKTLGTKTTLEFSTAFFNRKVRNWIQWLPQDGSFIWSAANIKAVRSQGMELRLGISQAIGKFGLELKGGYDLVYSTNLEAISTPSIQAGQQWFYVPKHQGFFKARASWKWLEFMYLHHFTGSVITEFGQLPAFQVATAKVDFIAKLKSHQVQFYLQMDNCWDASYRVVERRPMPGRSFQLGSTVKFQH